MVTLFALLHSKYAYVLVAIKGTSFCTSAKDAIVILIGNAQQIAVIEMITSFMFLLGKIFIVASAGLIAFAWLDRTAEFQSGAAYD
jgi:hypothetical protein